MNEEVVSIVEFSEDIASAEQPELLPEGSYPAQISASEVKVSNNSGNKYAALTFHININDFPADFPVENAPDGVNIIYRRVGLEDNPNSRYGLHKFCETVGAPMSSRIDVAEWQGYEAMVEVAHSEWNGEARLEITSVASA